MEIILKTEWTLPEAGHLILYWLSSIQQFSARLATYNSHDSTCNQLALIQALYENTNTQYYMYSNSNLFTYAEVKNRRYICDPICENPA